MDGRPRVLHVSKSAAEFSYHEPLIAEMCARGFEVRALFDEGYSDQRSDRAVRRFASSNEGFSTGWSLRPSNRHRRLVTALQEAATLGSYIQRTEQSPFYLQRFERGMPRWAGLALGRGPLRSMLHRPGVTRSLITRARRLPPDPRVVQSIRQIAPDLVVASPSNMRHSYEGEYLRAAIRLGIPTAVTVFSWDNLTTKSLFAVAPDRLLVWNRTQVDEAEQTHFLPRGSCPVVGAPLFDRWLHPRLGGRSRSSFCQRVGLNEDAEFIAYLGSTSGIAPDETWLVRELAEQIRRHENARIRRLAILVRPHPLNTRIYDGLDEPGVYVWPRGGEMPDSFESLEDFFDTIRFGAAAVGINTSAMVDTVVADRPCIAILAERYALTQEQAQHYQHLSGAGAVIEVGGTHECLKVVGDLLVGRDTSAEDRARFVQEYIRPRGAMVPAAIGAVDELEALLAGRPAS